LAPGDELGIGVNDLRELIHEPALSHPRYGDERDQQRRPLVSGALERVAQDAQLALPAHELCARAVGDVDAEAGVSRQRLPDLDRLGFALRLDGPCLAVIDCLASRAVSRLVHQDPIDRSG
jgi:hypothetical protein